MTATESPIQGTWYNAFCSRLDLSVSETGHIRGVYTSHTGSVGTSALLGQLDIEAAATGQVGTPFALGIQWRLINEDQSNADGSWHWVSMFAGQYHPQQRVSKPGQTPYTIPETLEILNLLIATATLPGLADTAPVTWPQTLDFHRSPPEYYQGALPGEPVLYTPTAADNVSGAWLSSDGERLDLRSDFATGQVTGSYTDADGVGFDVVGLVDTLAPAVEHSVSWQGVTLSLMQSNSRGRKQLKVLAGGVDYRDTRKMSLWSSDLRSTSWTDRFVQQSLRTSHFTRQ
ncbi:MAG: avidin/streptavidin family protein [Gammaproteobacteria bacterium]|nr:avidin/streptavidin family protein [Gammaproteobacteria bacterium]